jgi:DNA-binding MarR family transcriptional regulator
MTAFQRTREQTEQNVMVHLLSEIERNPSFTQRNLASDLGIALGLMNQYLKRCITKGWIRASQVSPKRITYFLTPEGFIEKSHMVKDYLARSMTFFRDARAQLEEIFATCQTHQWSKIALIGNGDLADIAFLVGSKGNFTITLSKPEDSLTSFDAVIITDTINPQKTYESLKGLVKPERIFVLALLHISREGP